MNRVLLVFVALLCLPFAVWAQQLSEADRQTIEAQKVREFGKTVKQFHEAIGRDPYCYEAGLSLDDCQQMNKLLEKYWDQHLTLVYVDWESAVKLGEQQSQASAAKKAEALEALRRLTKPSSERGYEPSLGEVARRLRLQKQLEGQVQDFCTKNPNVKQCKEETPAQIAKRLSEATDAKSVPVVSKEKQ